MPYTGLYYTIEKHETRMELLDLQIEKAKVKRLGLLGGTFDPIHNAHLRLANAAKAQFDLDEVLFLVSGEPPHKHSIAGKEERLAMVECALQYADGIRVTRMEIDREGMTYTVDSLRTLRSVLGEEVDLYYILGEDTLLDVPNWREYETVMEMVTLIVYFRKGTSEIDQENARRQLKKYSYRIFFGTEALMELSSTTIRKRSSQHLSLQGLVPTAVEDYIKEHTLYAECAASFEETVAKIEAALPKSRYKHTLGVIQCAQALAGRYGVDGQAAKWAALLHDCAKKVDDDEAIAMCIAWGIELDEIMLQATQLIHGPLGAQLAQREYGIEDADILDAIRYHTTGKPLMSSLCKIVFLADIIEPGRNFPGVKELRLLANSNLDKAVCKAMDLAIEFILQRNELLHPLTVLARNDLLDKK